VGAIVEDARVRSDDRRDDEVDVGSGARDGGPRGAVRVALEHLAVPRTEGAAVEPDDQIGDA
jgi:hypothetical protein